MKKYCSNCHYPLARRARFCHQCGQKYQSSRVPLSDLVQQVWVKVFHMESRYFAALYRLFIPGQVAIDYFKGFRKRYPPPVQFFFVVMFLFLVVNNYVENGVFSDFKMGFDNGFSDGELPYEREKRLFQLKEMGRALDSLPHAKVDAKVRARHDTMLSRLFYPDSTHFVPIRDDSTGSYGTIDSINFGSFGKKSQVGTHDFFYLDPDTLVARYQITPWYNEVFFRQGVKTFRDPKALMQRYLGSFAWALFMMALIGAGVLKLLYIRSGRFYVEHLIFLLLQGSADWLLITLLTILNSIVSLPDWILLGAVTIWLPGSMGIAIYRFYGQGPWKSFFKWLIFMVLYLAVGILVFIGTMILGILLL
jgi:Protein of unknown function (DUF3667)